MSNYDVKSKKAEEFVSNEEIRSTLKWAEENKDNEEILKVIFEKASTLQGLGYKEAAILLQNENEDVWDKIYEIAGEIKRIIYGKRIVLFTPLYISDYCVNECKYCSYHNSNCSFKRRKLSQDEIAKEVLKIQSLGHKRIALETGEDPVNCPIEYVLESIKTIYDTAKDNGIIRRVNVNIAATTVENYQKLKSAGIGTYILFQETYDKENYENYHTKGPKRNYAYHTEAMDRAMEGGIDDVGMGVLFGLSNYKYDTIGLLMHALHLEETFGVGPHTLSVPRINPASEVDLHQYPNLVKDSEFKKIVALLRVAVPYTGIILSTREGHKMRQELLKYGVSQISAGSCTGVGGYTNVDNTPQFQISDEITPDQAILELCENGYIPSFCTACYREGRTGDRFMRLAKSHQICNVCQPNALMTLKEYLMDYATPETKKAGEAVIKREIENIKSEKVKQITVENLEKIESGKRDFRL